MDPPDRAIPNFRLRWLILALQDQIGGHGLKMMLRRAQMQRYLEEPPPANSRLESRSGEYTRLLDTVRQYYGQGARGTLTRLGNELFRRRLAARPGLRLMKWLLFPLMSRPARLRWILDRLAAEMSSPGEAVQVREVGGNLALIDRSGDRTVGIHSDEPICWSVVGEISEAMLWATGSEPAVRELECRAMGSESCRFAIL